MKKLNILFLSMVLCFSAGGVLAAQNQNNVDPLYTNLFQEFDQVKEGSGLPSSDVRVVIARLIRVALGAVGIILTIIILYAGFLYMTAGGNEDQIDKAKKFIKNAVIGLVITMSAYAIANFVINSIQGSTNWIKLF